MRGRYLIAMMLALVLLPFTGIHSEAAVFFADVGTNHRATSEISYLAEGGIVTGDASGRFNPGREVNRAEAAAMLGRALNFDGTKVQTNFTDVSSGSFASGYIKKASDLHIISGYSDGTFRPDNSITRGEMALLISRAFGYGATSTTSAASQLMAKGIAQGISNGDFGFYQPITRADFSVFLARAINYKLRTTPSVQFNSSLKVTADSLNLRTGPSTKYEVKGGLVQGTEVEAAYKVGDWIYVRSGSLEGFVHGGYLTGSAGVGSGGNGGETGDNNNNNPISSQVIVIDAGHGGSDPGSSGFGLNEKDVTLNTALKVKALFANTPFQIKLTRETDKYVALAERVSFAKSVKGNVFVSIHTNAFTSSSAHGTESYYYAAYENPNTADSKLLATKIQKRMLDAWGLTNRGVENGDLYVLRENTMPATLVELGFITNKSENQMLASDSWRQKAAKAIYLGILDYYKEKGFNVSSLY
jgi:N-acetylmuramoyl-L-alanine amidase